MSARVETTYDLLLTQRLIAQPRLEINAAAQDARQFGVARGLNDIELGLRLRYEVIREIAPYVGINWRHGGAGAPRGRRRRRARIRRRHPPLVLTPRPLRYCQSFPGRASRTMRSRRIIGGISVVIFALATVLCFCAPDDAVAGRDDIASRARPMGCQGEEQSGSGPAGHQTSCQHCARLQLLDTRGTALPAPALQPTLPPSIRPGTSLVPGAAQFRAAARASRASPPALHLLNSVLLI